MDSWKRQHITSHAAADGDYFVCPGQTLSVSRSIHIARLNAAWPVCDECEWRFHTEGLSEKTVIETARIRDHRRQGIHRTEFGLRGPYLNALNRRMAEELVRIFCQCLIDRSTVPGSSQRSESREIMPERLSLAPVVIGLDGRSSSTDIFVGASSSIREFGLPVIDLGRSTAASLQEALRCLPESCGGILVTGAGCATSWTGLDVFDRSGDSVPVVWKDFGIRLQHPGTEANGVPPTAGSPGRASDVPDEVSELLRQIRSAKSANDHSDEGATRFDNTRAAIAKKPHGILQLVLPEPDQRSAWPRRMSRQSGALTLVDFEGRYRDWLSHWYPQKFDQRVIVETDDLLVRQRVLWLAETHGLSLIPRSKHESQSADDAVTIRIDEDDRFFTIHRTNGLLVSHSRLAESLNRALASHASHITVHADDISARFWLTDAARATVGLATEQIHDALAVTGLVCRLASTGRLQLQDL